jgi:rifampicin phosphotransferase
VTRVVLDWEAAAQAGAAEAGGKGWQLGRLSQYAAPVPPGFVVAASASSGRKPAEAPPSAVIAAVSRELERRDWAHQALAVRSSAIMEDSARTSFAGIHHSCLNVRGVRETLQAIQDVWDSLWTPQALAYRQRLQVTEDDIGMAVIVMPLLPAVASGVVFTCDPISGRDDQLLVHANWGLGVTVVGGQVDGDEYRLQENLSRDRLSLIGQRIGSKAKFTAAAAGGGTELRTTSAARSARAVLDPSQVLELGDLAKDVASALDYANAGYDVEWVWDGERYWIVQARPITARAHHTYPALASQPVYWSRGNTAEILPEPLSPLDWGLSRTMANRMLTRGYELSGYRTLPGTQRAGLFHGRVYLQTSLMQWEGYDALGIEPHAMNQLLGGRQQQITVPPATVAERWTRRLRILRYLRRSPKLRRRADVMLSQARQHAAAWLAQDLPVDNAELSQQLRLQFATVHAADDLFFLQGSGGGTLFNLVQLVEKYCPGEGHALTAALMAGGEASVTARQSYDLMELARIAGDDARALLWLRRSDRVDANWSRELAGDSPFRHAFAAFLQRYGHRGVYETYLRNPRWREAPGYLLGSIVNLIGTDPAPLHKRQQQAAADAWQRVRREMPFWLRPVVSKLVRSSRIESNHREAARSALVAYLEVLRRGARAIGQRYTDVGGLERADDIFNLTAHEVFNLAEGRLPAAAAARRAADRRRRLQAWAREREPEVIVEQGIAVTVPVLDRANVDEGKGRIWRGIPVGGGCARGSVRIARSPSDGLALAAGDVLVAPSTDPAWTPLFLRAGALIMETGGYLSHGAIVAREFGIPAVVNLPGILDQLRDCDEVEVDGARGVVRRL